MIYEATELNCGDVIRPNYQSTLGNEWRRVINITTASEIDYWVELEDGDDTCTVITRKTSRWEIKEWA